jgi:hypothetical protein
MILVCLIKQGSSDSSEESDSSADEGSDTDDEETMGAKSLEDNYTHVNTLLKNTEKTARYIVF